MRAHRAIPASIAVLGGLLLGCGADSFDPQPVSAAEAKLARFAIAQRVKEDRQKYDEYTRGARRVLVAETCFSEESGGIFCQVVFTDFFYDDDKWCSAGYVAGRGGERPRRVSVGAENGPGFECGSWSDEAP